jgi:hypothetical protein
MIRVGVAPFRECSTHGDKRFSAFCAKVNGRSIEEQYQAAKVLPDGSTGHEWRRAKGVPAVNREEVEALYARLWDQYIDENSHLIPILLESTGLSDKFGSLNSVCQVKELWRIRAKHMELLV